MYMSWKYKYKRVLFIRFVLISMEVKVVHVIREEKKYLSFGILFWKSGARRILVYNWFERINRKAI